MYISFFRLSFVFEEKSNWARPSESAIRVHFASTTFLLFCLVICYNTRADDQIIVCIRNTQWQNIHIIMSQKYVESEWSHINEFQPNDIYVK